MKQLVVLACIVLLAAGCSEKPKTFDEYIKQGREYVDSNEPYDAIKSFDEAVKLNPKAPDGHYGLGVAKTMVCYKEGKLCNDAMAHFETVLKIDSTFRSTHYNLALCEYRLGNFDKALVYINRAIELYPKDSDNVLNRGAIYLAMGDANKACLDYHKAQGMGNAEAAKIIAENCK